MAKTKTVPRRIGRALIILILILLFLYLGVNAFILLYAGRYILTPEEAAEKHADCALILGANVYSSGQLSPMLYDRVYTGVSLYTDGVVDRLVMSGDHGQIEYDEVNAMKTTAVELGVPADAVFMDHAGFSTYESAYRARAVFGAEKVIFVTQKYHLYRTIFIARQLGIEAYGVSADLRDYRNSLYNNLRESLARCKDLLFTLFKPDPTYLGEPIDLRGSGQQTDDLPIYDYPDIEE